MTDDYELLKLAANAGEVELTSSWNPLNDNAAALSLACALRLRIFIHRCEVSVTNLDGNTFYEDVEFNNNCIEQALRRAIVKAAADYEA